MPPPYVGIKPYAPARSPGRGDSRWATRTGWTSTSTSRRTSSSPGSTGSPRTSSCELGKLVRGEPHALSRTLLEGNPAWPAELAEAAQRRPAARRPSSSSLPLALSRTQDDKGNVRWTLFGASHDGRRRAPSGSSADGDARSSALVALGRRWRGARGASCAEPAEVPADAARSLLLGESVSGDCRRRRHLPALRAPARRACARRTWRAARAGADPASLVFFEHPRYRKLARELPQRDADPAAPPVPARRGRATRSASRSRAGSTSAIRPQRRRTATASSRASRARTAGSASARRRRSTATARSPTRSRSRSSRPTPTSSGSTASRWRATSQIWTDDYELAPRRPARRRAARSPGRRQRSTPAGASATASTFRRCAPARASSSGTCRSSRGATRRRPNASPTAPLGYVTAERRRCSGPLITLAPRLLDARRPPRPRAPVPARAGRPRRYTTTHNVRKLLEVRELLGAPLAAVVRARARCTSPKDATLDAWLERLPARASDRDAGERAARGAPRLRRRPTAIPGRAARARPTWARARSRSRSGRHRRARARASSARRATPTASRVNGARRRRRGAAGRAWRARAARPRARSAITCTRATAELIAKHGMTGRAEVGRPRVPLGDRLRVPLVGGLGEEPDRRGRTSATSCWSSPARTAARR